MFSVLLVLSNPVQSICPTPFAFRVKLLDRSWPPTSRRALRADLCIAFTSGTPLSLDQLVRSLVISVSILGLQDLVRAVEEAASSAGVRLRPLDKKAERAALQVQRQALQANLSQETDPAAALSLAVPLFVMQVMVLFLSWHWSINCMPLRTLPEA